MHLYSAMTMTPHAYRLLNLFRLTNLLIPFSCYSRQHPRLEGLIKTRHNKAGKVCSARVREIDSQLECIPIPKWAGVI